MDFLDMGVLSSIFTFLAKYNDHTHSKHKVYFEQIKGKLIYS